MYLDNLYNDDLDNENPDIEQIIHEIDEVFDELVQIDNIESRLQTITKIYKPLNEYFQLFVENECNDIRKCILEGYYSTFKVEKDIIKHDLENKIHPIILKKFRKEITELRRKYAKHELFTLIEYHVENLKNSNLRERRDNRASNNINHILLEFQQFCIVIILFLIFIISIGSSLQ